MWLVILEDIMSEPGKYRKEVNRSKGLGDTVSKFINKVTGGKVEECKPCKRRREMLNNKFPYKNNEQK
jgi:hypothetical protein